MRKFSVSATYRRPRRIDGQVGREVELAGLGSALADRRTGRSVDASSSRGSGAWRRRPRRGACSARSTARPDGLASSPSWPMAIGRSPVGRVAEHALQRRVGDEDRALARRPRRRSAWSGGRCRSRRRSSPSSRRDRTRTRAAPPCRRRTAVRRGDDGDAVRLHHRVGRLSLADRLRRAASSASFDGFFAGLKSSTPRYVVR